MNSENQIVTKITADIAGLKQGVAEAKQSLQDFQSSASNFTVNWEGGSGSIDEYNKALEQSKAEWEDYQANYEQYEQERENLLEKELEAARKNRQAYEEYREATQSASNATSEMSEASDKAASSEGLLAKMTDSAKTAFQNAGYSIDVYREEIETADRRTKTALIAMATAMIGFGVSSIKEYAKYSQEAKATQDSLASSVSQLKASFGAALQPIVSLAANLANLMAQNKEITTVLLTMITVVVGANGAVAAFSVFRGALATTAAALNITKLAAGGLLAVIGLIIGAIVVANTNFGEVNNGLNETDGRIAELQAELADLDAQIASASSTASSAGGNARKEIEKTRKELENLNFEFNQQLKQIAVNHEKTLQDLTSQIEQENIEYNKAIEERRAKFEAEQAKEEEEHQDKVDELTKQINFLQRYNNKYNKEKLAQLQYALEKENKLYQARTEAEQAELDAQIAAEEASHNAKLANLQAELDDELAFQEKHREALQGVRDIILLDEIESLQRQHDAQIASYNEQLSDALSYGGAAGNNYSQAQIDALKARRAEIEAELNAELDRSSQAYNSGYNAATSWTEGVRKHLGEGGIVADMWKIILGEETYNKWMKGGLFGKKSSSSGGGWATGGYTGYGAPDEIAGLVHKGEYVLRADQVDQSTGLPKSMGNNVTINVSGTFATSASERRKVAEQIATALNQVQKARLIN